MSGVYRYAGRPIAAAYARSAAGLGCTLGPLIALEPASWLSSVLVLTAALFIVYLARSIARHSTQIVVDAIGIRAEGLFGSVVDWRSLRAVALNYYTTHSGGGLGWIELVVRGASGSIRIESSLSGFGALAERVAHEAVKRNCTLDDRTQAHLRALGIDMGLAGDHDSAPLPGARHA